MSLSLVLATQQQQTGRKRNLKDIYRPLNGKRKKTNFLNQSDAIRQQAG